MPDGIVHQTLSANWTLALAEKKRGLGLAVGLSDAVVVALQGRRRCDPGPRTIRQGGLFPSGRQAVIYSSKMAGRAGADLQ